MTYVARVLLGSEDGHAYQVTGRGTTPEEATQEVMRQVGADILVELDEGVLLPVDELDKMPKELPPGKCLVIFARSSHNDGHTYNYRFFAISPGNFTVDRQKVTVIDGRTALVDTLDSNADVLYRLPKGSMEYKDGQWVQSRGVDYNY